MFFYWSPLIFYYATIGNIYLPDMIHWGIIFEARALAIQYGDGECLVEFWRDSLHWYNLRKKVQLIVQVQGKIHKLQVLVCIS